MLHREQRTTPEFAGVSFQHSNAEFALPRPGDADKPYDSRVLDSSNDGQFSEVLVEGNDGSALGVGQPKDFLVTGIALPV